MSKRTKNRKGGSEHPCSTRRVRYARGSRARERRRGGGGGRARSSSWDWEWRRGQWCREPRLESQVRYPLGFRIARAIIAELESRRTGALSAGACSFALSAARTRERERGRERANAPQCAVNVSPDVK